MRKVGRRAMVGGRPVSAELDQIPARSKTRGMNECHVIVANHFRAASLIALDPLCVVDFASVIIHKTAKVGR